MTDIETANRLGISRRLLWRLVSTGQAPKPKRLPGARVSRWDSIEVESFIGGLSAE